MAYSHIPVRQGAGSCGCIRRIRVALGACWPGRQASRRPALRSGDAVQVPRRLLVRGNTSVFDREPPALARDPWPYAGAAVALIVFTPVIVWNVQHLVASLAFQNGRATGAYLQPLMPLATVAGIAVC